jgi:hypothetical protein
MGKFITLVNIFMHNSQEVVASRKHTIFRMGKIEGLKDPEKLKTRILTIAGLC